MQEDYLDKLIKQQVDICKEATIFATTSFDLLKHAVIRIYELEQLVQDLSSSKTSKKKIKKSKKKKDK